ncbi:MAG: AAA family ATPase, partial [bacterium]
MYLKRIELHGFKSFADKSTIEFMPGITGIVGPNGCGKSNITDAIRWVLGEKSAKAMRGDTMSDVIFQGSEDRRAQNLAEVTLVFDNEDHYLEIDANEVEITRRLYRQGSEGEYLINRTPCRMKDILDLVTDKGLGKDSLSIISQNSINEFVRSKPEERRLIFEEAAGVAKYKRRKKETINKLTRTTTNLERVEDICRELEKQIGPLARQKEKAETYLTLKEALEAIEVSVLVKEIGTLSAAKNKLLQEIKGLEEQQVINEQDITLGESQVENLRNRMLELDGQIDDLQGELLTTMNALSRLETQRVESDAKREALLASGTENDALRIELVKAKLKDALDEYNDRAHRYQELNEQRRHLYNSQRENEAHRGEIRDDIEKKTIALHQLRSQRIQLIDTIENKSGYPSGVRAILKAQETLPGIKGVVSELFEARDGYETAIGTALGSASHHIVSRTDEDAKGAIAFLANNAAGRATFLPISNMKPRTLREDAAIVARDLPGYLGIASEFVTYPADMENIALNLLGNIIVVDTIDHATALARTL